MAVPLPASRWALHAGRWRRSRHWRAISSPRVGAPTLREDAVAQFEYGKAETRLRAARAFARESAETLWNDVAAGGSYTPNTGSPSAWR